MNLLESFISTNKGTLELHKIENSITRPIDEESYLEYTLKNLAGFREEYYTAERELQKTLLESADMGESVLLESFDVFTDKVRVIIKRVLKFIKTMYDKFIARLAQFVKSDKFILKNEYKIKKFSDGDSFDYTGYTFTINDNIPVINALLIFDTDFINISLDKEKTQDNVIAAITAAHQEIQDDINNGYYDRIRGEVLDQDPITMGDFANKAFSVYRDGDSEKGNVVIRKAEALEALSFFKDYKNLISKAKSTKNALENQYKIIEKQLTKISNASIRSDGSYIDILLPNTPDAARIKYSNNLMSILDLYVSAKIHQVQEVSDIHLMAFASKIDALNECVVQSRNVLYQVIKTQNTFRESALIEANIDYYAGFFEGEDITGGELYED